MPQDAYAFGEDASREADRLAEVAAGLTEIRGREHRLLAPGGPDWLRSGLERLRAELLNEGFAERDLDPALKCLDDPENLISGPPIVIGWDRRR